MAIAHDASTRWPATENTADTTSGDRTVTHTPSGTPAGVAVVICSAATSAPVTGVLYGSLALQLAQTATDTSEAGRVDVYTSPDGTAIPTGAQTVTLRGCTTTAKFATINTVTSGTNFSAVNIGGVVNTTTAANPSVSLTTSATTMTYGGVHTGAAAPAVSALTGCTLQNNRDYGALAANTVRRTSADASGTVTLGVTLASDDYCVAAVAVTESAQIVNPVFGSIGTHQQGSVSTLSVDVPDGVAADDIIVIPLFMDGAGTITALASGFAEAPDSPVTSEDPGGGQHHTLHVLWKRATGADSTAGTYDFTLSGSSYCNADAARYTGAVTSGSPWDVTNSAVDVSGGGTSPAVSDTTTVNDAELIWTASNWTGGAWTAPAGFTKRLDTGDRITCLADKAQAAAGATGSISGSSAGTGARAAWLGALKPAGGATTHAAAGNATSTTSTAATLTQQAAATGAATSTTTASATITQTGAVTAAATSTTTAAADLTITAGGTTHAASGNATSTTSTTAALTRITPMGGAAATTTTTAATVTQRMAISAAAISTTTAAAALTRTTPITAAATTSTTTAANMTVISGPITWTAAGNATTTTTTTAAVTQKMAPTGTATSTTTTAGALTLKAALTAAAATLTTLAAALAHQALLTAAAATTTTSSANLTFVQPVTAYVGVETGSRHAGDDHGHTSSGLLDSGGRITGVD